MSSNDSSLVAMDATTGGDRGVGPPAAARDQPAVTASVPPDSTPRGKRQMTSQTISPSKDVPQYGRTAGTVSWVT